MDLVLHGEEKKNQTVIFGSAWNLLLYHFPVMILEIAIYCSNLQIALSLSEIAPFLSSDTSWEQKPFWWHCSQKKNSCTDNKITQDSESIIRAVYLRGWTL